MKRRGTVIVKDSNKSDWLYVIVSVSHRGRGGGGGHVMTDLQNHRRDYFPPDREFKSGERRIPSLTLHSQS